MFERTFSIDKPKKMCLEYLYNKLKQPVKDVQGIIIFEEDDRCSLHIGCPDESKGRIWKLLSEYICDIFCISYKYEYFQRNLKMPKNSLINFKTFLKSMVAFDGDNERDLVKTCLYDTPHLALDGFYNFRLSALTKRWQTVCKLTNENSISLTYTDIFLEFLSFLIATVESKHKTVNVYHTNGIFEYYSDKNKKIPISELLTEIDDNIDENILAALITIAPEHVLLHFDNVLSKNTLSMLNILFSVSITKS